MIDANDMAGIGLGLGGVALTVNAMNDFGLLGNNGRNGNRRRKGKKGKKRTTRTNNFGFKPVGTKGMVKGAVGLMTGAALLGASASMLD